MNKKLSLLLAITLLALLSTAVLTSDVSADPPPCMTTNLCFETAIRATKFTGAEDLAVGYINAGGNLDVVATGWSRDKIRLKTGSGDGTFWGTWTMNMGDGTYEVDIADFNGDGLTDIITTNTEQDRVFIRWGHNGWNGASVWATGDRPYYIATGDLNDDGLDDFATVNTQFSLESITVRLRQPGGGFAPATTYTVNEQPRDIAFNDCDHDGDLDMFYTAYESAEAHIYLRLNEGDGTFTAAWAIDMASEGGFQLGEMAFGDLDEDGWDDIIVTRNDDNLVRVLGGMNCGFHDPIVANVQSDPHHLEIADLNGDGHLDVVLSHIFTNLITIFLGQGNGNMSGPYQPDLDGLGDVYDVGTGDFNNDGLMDIVFAEESGVWLLLAREANAPPWVPPLPEINGMYFAPAGQSEVEVVLEEVIVSNFGTSGADGVDVLVDSAELWSADIAFDSLLGSKIIAHAVANETVTGSVQLVATQPGLELWPMFNPTTYRIEYLLGDQVQLALTLPSNGQTPAAIIHWDPNWCIMNSPPNGPSEICRVALEPKVSDFPFRGIQIYCVSGEDDFGTGLPLMMTAANGNLVTADNICMTEIPDGQVGSAENGFSRVEIRGAALDSLTLSNMMMESAEPPLPAPGGSMVRSWNSQNGPYFTIFDVDNPGTLPNVAPFPAGGNFIRAGEYINGLSYMIDDANNVYVVDDTGTIQNTFAATPPPNGETYSGMALNAPEGKVFVTSTNGTTSSICVFDIFTGNTFNCNPISGPPGDIAVEGLAITEARDANWVVSVTYWNVSVLGKVDPYTGITSNVTPLPFEAGPEIGLACDPVTELLVMVAHNENTGRGELWTVDISDPEAPVFNFVEVLGVSFPGGSNLLTWAGIDLGASVENRVNMPIVLHAE